jgi:hypothetical protein
MQVMITNTPSMILVYGVKDMHQPLEDGDV